MKQSTIMGLMIGTMAGIALAVGLHMLLTAQPSLVHTWLGGVLARVAAPGARMIGLFSDQAASHEMGILTHWLSLQLSLVALGASTGALVAFFAERWRTQASGEPTQG